MRLIRHRLLVAGVLALVLACAGPRPLVERFDAGSWHPTSYRLASMGGQRAGSTISFILRADDPAGLRLTLEGTVEINPQPSLVEGRWVEQGGDAPRSGVVSAAALDFFGGQGGRPSLGGQFTLSNGGTEVYRLNLPTTELTRKR